MNERLLKVVVRLASSMDDLPPDLRTELSELYVGDGPSPPASPACCAGDPSSAYVCTRALKHSGVHVAHYSGGLLCDTLPWWD